MVSEKKEGQPSSWDLSDLAPDYKSPLFQEYLQKIDEKVEDFEDNKEHLKNDIRSDAFYNILDQYEDIIEEISRIGSYTYLLFASDTSNPEANALMAKINNFNAKIANRLIFFTLWWKKGLEEYDAKRLLKDAGQLTHFLARQRTLAKYTLTELEEKIINMKDTTGVDFICKLYDQYTERFVFRIKLEGKKRELSKPDLISLFYSPDSKKRVSAYRSLLSTYRKNEPVLGELYRNIVLDWKNEGVDLRGYKSPLHIRNIINDVSNQSVEALLSVCQKRREVFQRYFKEKSNILGMKKMSRYHIYAPIENMERKYRYSEAVKLVIEATRRFSPKMAELAEKVLKENHIDSMIRKGKRGGAFCSTPSPGITPFVLLNFTGKQRDVSTLAHELGHAVHSLFASKKSILNQRASLPLAELSSVFLEMVILDMLFENASPSENRILIANHIDDLYATIMRQAYFTIFEREAHESLGNGATINHITEIYLENLKEQFGSAVNVPNQFKYEWTYIPHFYHTPFYTYAYSFGNLLTISLYQRYQEEGTDFVDDYKSLLSAGGSRNPEKLLEEEGINVRSEDFWHNGFQYINQKIRELENL